MSTFKCKMCGGTLEIQSGSTVAECEYCGAKQTLPKLDDEKRANLYDRANHFRRSNEFDKASAIYEQILAEDNTDAEAYWSLVLCRYGIEYVEDPLSHRRVPTVHRAQFTSIFDDDNYKSALKNSDTYQRVIYEEEAKAINEIQKGILAISQKEEPFDVFICYKETDDSGKRTHDSVLAQDLYYQLKQEGFKVFFSRITLEDKLGSAYEPYIFAALNSAKVMVVLGTKPEYFNAVWVKNEWSRFLSLIKKGEKKMLIPAYKDMDPYNLPKEFSHLQAQDMSKLGFMQDLIRGIKKILGRDKKPAAPTVERVVVQGDSHAQDAAPLLRRAFLFLEDGEFDNADEYAEKVLDINPECAEAYIVKLLIELRLKKPSDLAQCKNPISDSHNYQKALRFATPEYRETIEGYNNAIIKRIDTARKDEVYARGVELMRLHRYDEAVQYFQKIPTYKDSTQKIDDCKKLKETERRDGIYERATQLLNAGQFDEAARLFESIEDHKDSKEKIKLCGERKETARKDAIYSQAMNRVRPQNADDAAIKKSIEELQTISGYRDVDDQIRALNTRLEKWYEDKKKAEEAARIKAEEERRTREREAELRRIKAEKTKKTVKKVAKIGIPSVVALATLLILLFTLVIPLIRYNKADELFNAGKYDEAMEIYQDIGGFSDSEQRITILTGIEKIDGADFEEGIEKILSAGVPVKLTYGMGGGDFSGTTYLSAPQEENNSGITLLSASTTSNVTPLAATTTASVPETVEYTYNSSADFSGIQTPGRSGYRFVEWELEVYNYQIGGTFEMKLNAVWSEKEYTIEYDLNDGKVATKNPLEYGIEDDSFTLVNPTKTGYTFIGWTGTDLNGLTMSVTIEKGSVGNRSYEANWQANTYTLTFDANGGTVDPTSITVTYDQDYTVPTPIRDGYTFHGWKFNGVEYEGGKWQVASDVTVVADWVSYTLTTNTNNANAGTFTEKNSVKTTEGDSITLTATTNAGYTFNGWFEGTTKVSSNLTYTFKMPGKNVTLTAKWTANTYTVTYDDTQATRNNVVVTFNYNYSGSTSTTVTLTNGQKLNYPTNPTRSGYVFAGWYTNSSCTTAYNFSGTITADMTLYANWKTCTITNNSTYSWSSSGGVLTSTNKSNSSSSTYKITATMPVTISFSYKTSSESGYDYLYIKKNGSQLKSCSGSTSYVSYSVTLNTGDYLEFIYSKDGSSSDGSDCAYIKDLTYTSNASYTSTATASCSTVTGYEYADGETVSTSVTFGSSHTLPALTRTGYSFLGWYNGNTKVESGNWSIASNVTLTPRWQAGGNTITLDANGGTVTPNSIPVSYDQTYTLPTPTWTGHTFAGWYYNGTQYSSGTWTGLSDITLTARWTTNDYSITFDDIAEINTTATITYNYNYSGSTSSTVTLTNGQTLSRPTNPTRSGYVFTGWYTNSSCTTRYEFTGTITGDMTLYAGWKEMSLSSVYSETEIDPTDYTSSSDYYSVSTSSTYSSSKKHIYLVAEETGTHYIYWKNSKSYSYYGYYLQIYNLTTGTTIRSSSNTYSTSYQSSSFTCSKGDVIVISLYRYDTYYSSTAYFYFDGFDAPAASTVTASLPAGGYEYKNNSTYIDSVDYGENYTLPVPTRTGYTFGGWYNGNTKVESGAWNIASNVTLTAKWTANTYTVNFNANGGSVSPTSKIATYDSSFTLPTPTWEGHTFSGWYNGSTKITSGTWKYTTGMNLTAHWDAVDYTISYTLNGGTNNSSNPSTYTVNDSFTLKDPTKTGYTFLGWTYSGQTTPTKNVTISTGTMGNLSYTANWEIIDYTVTLNANGGSVTPSSLTVNYNTSFTLPTPTRTGYTFAGWYKGSTQYTSGTWTDLTNVTLTASWTVNEYTLTYEDVSEVVDSITVTFNYNYSGSTSSTVTLTNGQTLTYPTVPTRSGYAFAGWYTNSSCTTAYSFSGTLTEDTTLYAKWVSMASSYSTREYVDIKNYNSSSSKKSVTITASSSSSQNYYYFTCYKAGTYNFYSAYATGDFYITVYNATKGSYILERTNLYSGNASKSTSFTADAGDVIYVSLYKYSSSGSTGTGTFYVSGASYPTSTATASVSTISGLIYDTNSSYEYVVEYDENYTLPIPHRTGYTFDGWYFGSNKIESGIWAYTTDMTLTAKWDKNTYTITFDADGGECNTTSQTVVFDENYSLPTPTRTGYTFAGWYSGSTNYTGGTWTTASNVTLTASWTANGDIPYVVNHHKQNIAGTGYEAPEVQNLTGVAGASIKPAVKSYTGFTSPSVKTVTVAPDGTLVVDYYYTRNSYSITLVTNGGDSITTITQKYQSSVTVPNATRTGYTFGGWYTNKALTTEYTGTTISASNITLYAYWAEENKPGDFTYSGTSAITVSAYSGTSTTMWIPAYIGGVPVTTIPASAFANQTTLTKVVIPETVTAIGEGALKGCSALEDLTIPFVGSSASANQTNDAVLGYIFGRYTSSASSKPTGTVYQGWSYKNDSYLITSTSGYNYSYSTSYRADYYYIPTTIKSLTITQDTTIPYGAFQNCDFIEAIVIPNTTTSIGAFAFKNCKGITEVNLGTALESIGRYAFDGCISLGKVTMPNSVTTIGTYTFNGCVALTKINSTTEGVAILPTSLTSIPAYAFQNCSGITNISVTNITSVGTYAFNGCNYITRINGIKDGELILPNGLTTIGAYAFQNLAEITKIVVPNTVTEIGIGAFKGCISLADITLPFIGKTAESSQSNEAVFGHIFGMYGSATSSKPTGTVYQGWSYKNDSYLITGTYGNNYSNSSSYRADYYYIPTTIKNVTITVDTTIPYGAFQNCDFIESISILSTTTSIDAFAFRNCKGLTTMNLGTTLTSIGRYAFSGCISLESISMPNTVSSIGSHAFDGCITLKKMNSSTEGTISLPTSLTSISSYIFQGCTEITKVVVGDITSIGTYAFSGCENITQFNSNTDGQLIIPSGVTTIGEYAFQNLSSITKIVVPDTVTEIGNGAFKGCSALEDITIPFIGKTVDSSASAEAAFGYIFGKYASEWSSTSSKPTGTIYQGWECYSSSYLTSGTMGRNYSYKSYYRADYYYIPTTIKSVTITQDTTIPYGAFHNCDFIESITLPTTITSVGSYAFMNCDGLTAMSLGTKLTSIGTNAFEGCINLATISIPNTVESIGSYAFNGCVALKRMNSTTDGVISLPASVTAISSYAFQGCTSITKMVVGDIASIGAYALSGCENITQFNSNTNGELIIPSGVKTIGEYAFQNLASITKVVVPDTVTEIGEGAFKGCNAIEDITLPFIGKTATASGSSDALFGYIFGRYASSASTTPTGTVYQGWGTYSSSYPTSGTSGKNYHQSSYYYAHYYYIPSTIKNVTITVDTTIPYGAFQNCSFIETIVLPTTVTSVGNYAYQNCSATVSQTYETKTDMSWDGTTVATDFGSGDGTQANPYIISTGAELALLSQKVNDGETFAGVYFKLAKNISLNGKTFTTIGSKNNKFEGIFDGNGCVISNFKISTSESYAGLFGYVSGTIQNLGVQGTVSVSGTSANAYVGMIAGYNTGTIQNCFATGSVTLSSANTTHAGGLVGYNEGNIINSYATTNVTSTSTGYMAYAGGLVGYAKSGTISGSYAAGDVKAQGTSSDYSRNGGLVGFLNSDATVANCYRSELQLLTRYTTAGASYCEEGTSASIETIKAYVSANWSSVIWSFNNTHPRFVEN